MRLVFADTLTHEDAKRNIAHTFQVPPAITRLRIELTHEPHHATGAEYPNQISLSLFDPDGFRGARHNNRDQTVLLSGGSATPGYLPGEIVEGTWTVVLDTHRIVPQDQLAYRITVNMDSDPIEEPTPRFEPGPIVPRGPGWYRGDLHGHTLHSDGSWDVPQFVRHARDNGLDFVTLTDHNTVSGLAELDSLRGDDLLTIGGMELTTYYGHALALGTREWHEWRAGDGQAMAEIARSILEKGLLFVVVHPRSPGDPACTGCRWEFDEIMPGPAPAVEVWNGAWHQYNEDGLQLYYRWLNEGHRLVATAGSDIHRPPAPGAPSPAANVVYAEELSESGVLDAIRQGRLYLSSGPDLRLTAADDSGTVAMMGDSVARSESIYVHAEWRNTESGDSLRLIVDGTPYEERDVGEAHDDSWTLAGDSTRWFLVEVRDADGALRAITNPIFVE